MSTRCQVQVIQKENDICTGRDFEEKITLYHHTDGYPSYMIPTIYEAFKYESKYVGQEDWRKGRAGKVASFLCWADPGVFEPEEGHELHCDIEYYYKLYCINPEGGHCGDKPYWEVEIFETKSGFWDKSEESMLKVHTPRTRLETLVKKKFDD